MRRKDQSIRVLDVEVFKLTTFVLYQGAGTYVICNTDLNKLYSTLSVWVISMCWNLCDLQHNNKIVHLCIFQALYLKVPNRMCFTTLMQHTTFYELAICFIWRSSNICKLQQLCNSWRLSAFPLFYYQVLKHM